MRERECLTVDHTLLHPLGADSPLDVKSLTGVVSGPCSPSPEIRCRCLRHRQTAQQRLRRQLPDCLTACADRSPHLALVHVWSADLQPFGLSAWELDCHTVVAKTSQVSGCFRLSASNRQVSVVTLLSGTQRARLGFPAGPADHLIRRVCRQCSRPGYIPCDLVGRHSLVRVISLSCAVLYGQIQASADQDHRLIPSMRTTGAYDDGPPSAACPRCLWWCMRAVLLAHEHQAPSAL